MPSRPDEIIRDEIRALSGYHVPDADGMIKLDAMENPYRLPPEMSNEIAARIAHAALNRYPDAGARELKAGLRRAMGIPPGMDLVLGNGSDELIQMIALAVAKPGAVLLALEPSFVMFRMIATFVGIKYVGVPLESDFSMNEQSVLAAIEQHRPALVFIAYPNNPSGNLFDAVAVARIIAAAPGLVVIDEAYHAFAGRTFMPRLHEFPNMLVMRTLSKLGLAGLRLGLLAGSGDWLRHIDKIRLPYNVNVLTQLAAAWVVQRIGQLESQALAVCNERSRLLGELRGISGVEPYPSDANFILFKVTRPDNVFNGLKRRGVLIKNLNGTHPLLAGCLRVTVGTPDENARFLSALTSSLSD